MINLKKIAIAIVASLAFVLFTNQASFATGWCSPQIGNYLGGCDFSNRFLQDAQFNNSNLEYADFTNADLTDADFFGTDLTGVDFSGSVLAGVISGEIVGEPINLPSGWSLTNGYLVGPKANLYGANLSGGLLAGRNLSQINFGGSNLTSANLSGSNFTSASFAGAYLSGANLNGSNFASADFSYLSAAGVLGTPSRLPANWFIKSGFLLGPKANVSAMDLSFLDLSSKSLAGAQFDGANLAHTNFTSANLDEAFFNGDISIEGANFTNASIKNIVQYGTLNGNPYRQPTGFIHFNDCFIGSGLTLYSRDLSDGNFQDLDLSGSNLSLVSFANADLTGANFADTTLESVDFTGATLSKVFTGNRISSYTNLITFPSGWKILRGYFLGPEADLTGADLSGLNLSRQNLSGANLTNANLYRTNLENTQLAGASLDGIKSGKIIGNPATLPSLWAIRSGYLAGIGADLSGSNLAGLNFSNLDLSNADFSRSNLTGSNFTGATLTGANFSEANLSNVVSSSIVGAPIRLPSRWVLSTGKLLQTFVKTAVPSISGSLKVGKTLSAVEGVWDSGVSFSYQWIRSGKVISGATGKTYKLTSSDKGKKIQLKIVVSKSGYLAAQAASSESPKVKA